jgi:hypothetical protein
MMKPIEDPAGPPLVPVPRERRQWRRLLPSLGFVALVAVHETLGCAAALLCYRDRSFVALQVSWYCAWEAILLAYFVHNHVMHRGLMGAARLTAFWLAQTMWFTLGLWCFGVLFAAQPFAVEGVGAWLVGAYVLAALTEDLGRPRTGRFDTGYLNALLKRPMSEE